ncbi:exodeoxyribonuclease V subunit beta [Pseudoxanthomonas koreensis]|uniref:exodeoxyribonuclease V subunit beta n=1 Tax=Pseudoxanthomonas koreensis TaxID=266061 RepID=UPI0013916D19|nr:exodeoxyribonuclease V subunit beta [Pseudoxanthomonas koreensis]KAF1694156.1 exodeoxyribonuclease V subunit beta [Pseudoxanthomonas koreensis]
MSAQDAYLSLPLSGVRAIEASAGTGKTFTLATLVVRLVLERALPIERILAVTFTEAATQELRARVRRRLLLAAGIAAGVPYDGASPEATLTAALIDAHVASSGEAREQVARRLRAAADGIDQAAVFTIHGFCARVLREHALESGQGFHAQELLANDQALREAIAADLWRAHARDDDSVEDLTTLWSQGHKALAQDLSLLVREAVLLPPPPAPLPDPTSLLHAAAGALVESARTHAEGFRESLLAAVEGKVLNANSYKVEWIEDLFAALRRWCAAGDPRQPFTHGKLGQLQRQTLQARTLKAAAGRTPDSPLCTAVEGYAVALAAMGDYREARRATLLHRIREDARRRLAAHKQQLQVQTYDDLIDRVAAALDGPHTAALAQQLRAQYAIALVDEFQDTDPRQWKIFDRVFGAGSDDPALFVIGDPKQAIYGFRGGDVETYLAARATAEQAPPLSHNFRSRPAVLGAIEALYAQADAAARSNDKLSPPFVDERIEFHAVQPGGKRADGDYLRAGVPAPALVLWQAPPPKDKAHKAGESRELATAACVAAIHAVLGDARAGRATIDGRPVQPGDIAVLVRKHREATMIREALARVGIPAVAAGKQSLFATAEAHELHVLLEALLHGGDESRLRAALATVLVGEDAQRLSALKDDSPALRQWQDTALGWRERFDRGGPLALVNELCAWHATRLLALLDGERRLTNYLQLAEQLQEAQRHAPALHGLVDWLEQVIAAASADDDAQLLRLESDARRVQVVTLHKSKGLEYPLVFLPYAGIGGKPPDAGRRVVVHEGEGRVLHWKLQAETSGWEPAVDAWKRAQRAEDARLLYVGLTRARDALWLATGAFYSHAQSPLWTMVQDPAALAARARGSIVIDQEPPPAALPWLPPQAEGEVPPVRRATRTLASDWWVYSFTQLANADTGHDPSSAAPQPAASGRDEPGEADAVTETASADDGFDPRFAGARFGVVMHEVLETADSAAWRDWRPGDPAPAGEHGRIVESLRRGGYGADEVEAGTGLLTALAGQALTVALPEGTRLADVPEPQRRPEIEFQFALAPTRIDRLLALLHAHGLLRTRQGFGGRRQLEGLMTGLIDLTYVHDGRWYVLDYKSNRLPAYHAAAMDEAMEHSEYPLQALIYTIALHRWLRFHLGAGYDYARDFGGVRYLFCRGLDASQVDSPGVQAWRFAPELLHAVDALFAGQSQEAAA